MKNGCTSRKTSIASASANSCASERLKPTTRPDHLAQLEPRRRRQRLEAVGRRELERDAGEMVRQLLQRHAALAERRVVDQHLVASHRGEDDEVVQIPVQDARRLQLRRARRVRAAAAACARSSRSAIARQVRQARALERDAEAAPQFGQVDRRRGGSPRPSPGRRARIRRLRSAAPSAAGWRRPKRRLPMKSMRSELPGQGVERFEDPLVELAPLEQDVGFELHARMQRLRFAVGIDRSAGRARR